MSTQSSSKTKLSLRFKLLIPLIVMISLNFALTFFGLQTFLTDTIFNIMDDEIANLLEITQGCLDADKLQAFTSDVQYDPSINWPDGMNDSRYWEQQACLEDTVHYNPRALVFTYYSVNQNTLAYGLDSLATIDPAQSTPFGERITAETDDDFDYLQAGLQGVYPFDELYYDEEHDVSYLGTTAPIKNSAGKTVGGLAVYLEANSVVRDLDNLSYFLLIGAPIIYLLLLGTILLITSQATSRLRDLTAVSERVAGGDYTPITLKKSIVGDEVSSLVEVFNVMLEKVRGREETLKKRVKELEIIIDTEKRDQRVQEIVDSDFFQDIQSRAAALRERQKKDNKDSDTD